MKKIFLAILLVMVSIRVFAYNDLKCSDENDPSLTYVIEQISHSDRYLLSVTQEKKVIYTETLKFLDWQGEGEYTGRYSYITNNGDEFINFFHKGSWLKSTTLKCEAL